MQDSYQTPARVYTPGIGDAVADRTYNRKLSDGSTEKWADVAKRVSMGNASLCPNRDEINQEFHKLHHHMRQASILMAGRHLQHGDTSQADRNMEVFTNCSTSVSTFLSFYLLLNGSGVGRAYDDDMIVVDFNYMPLIIPVIDKTHPDVGTREIMAMTKQEAEHLYVNTKQHHYRVPDSREGWAKAIELIETLTFAKSHRKEVVVLDFSDVRPRGALIGGMQNRPASGPGPLMSAIGKLALLRDAKMAPWRAAMYADHYMSDCVLMGGARRSARMSTKTWRDKSVIDFIKVKREGKTTFLWTSNNSVTVDEEFWKLVHASEDDLKFESDETRELARHAKNVFETICWHSYHDKTGEPGLINQDKLVENNAGLEKFIDGDFIESKRYKLDEPAKEMMAFVARRFRKKKYKMITNPCGEITLAMLGAYCVLGTVVPFHAGSRVRFEGDQACFMSPEQIAEWDEDVKDAFRATTRALMRVNLMDSLYKREVDRTNRIGVGITGIHEYAWVRFGLGFYDLIDEERSKPFWMMMAEWKRTVREEAIRYAKHLGVQVPHTDTTMKPDGTVSKLFSLTESAHLAAMLEYLRWVQFRSDDPRVEEYRRSGYPTRDLQQYGGTTIVGFPTRPTICTLGMGDKLVTATEASPEQQYQWLRLLEKYWIRGVDAEGQTLLVDTGNQVSYTMKYDPTTVSYEEFKRTMLAGQPLVKCCTVMPTDDDDQVYEYLPEQSISKHEFEVIAAAIERSIHEDIGREHVDCSTGACPITFKDPD